MVWRGDIEKHNENVDKAFAVLELIDYEELGARKGVRDVILRELELTCKCIIEWIDDDKNKYSQRASLYLESFDQGYDICVIIEARTFIYQLLDKTLYDILRAREN